MNRSFPPLPDEVMLGRLRELLASSGKLSQSMMDEHPGIPHAMTYRKHFGSLRRAYELIGYRLSSQQLKIPDQSRRRRQMQKILIAEIEKLFPNQGRVCFVKNRPVFTLDDGHTVLLRVCYCFQTPGKQKIRWWLAAAPSDRHLTTLLCLGNLTNDGFEGFHLLPSLEGVTKHTIQREADPVLQRGVRIASLSELPAMAQAFASSAPKPAKPGDESHFFYMV